MVEWHHTTTPTGWQFTTYEPNGKVDQGTTGRTGKPQPYDQLHQRLHRERHLAIRIPKGIVFVDNDTHKHPEQDTPLTQQLWTDLRQSPTWTIGVRGIDDATRMYRLPIGAEWQPGDTTQWAGGELLAWWHRWQAIGHHMTTKGQEAYKVRYDGIDPPSVDYGWPDLNALPRLPGGLWTDLLKSAVTDLDQNDQHGDSGGWEEGRPPGPTGDMFAHALTQLPTIQSTLGGRQVGTRQHDGNTLTDYQHAKATHRRSYSITNPGQPNERVRFFSPNVIGADFDDSGSTTYDRLDIQCLKQHGRTDPNIRTKIARQHSPTEPTAEVVKQNGKPEGKTEMLIRGRVFFQAGMAMWTAEDGTPQATMTRDAIPLMTPDSRLISFPKAFPPPAQQLRVIGPDDVIDFDADQTLNSGWILSVDPDAPTVIGGPYKSGKSHALLSIVTDLIADQEPVVVWTTEGISAWYSRTRNYPPELRPQIVPGARADSTQIAQLLDTTNATTLIVDPIGPLYAMLGLAENEASDAYQLLDLLKTVANGRKLVIAHHTGKDSSQGLRGSSVIADAAGILWQIDTAHPTAICTAKVTEWRNGDRTHTPTLTLNRLPTGLLEVFETTNPTMTDINTRIVNAVRQGSNTVTTIRTETRHNKLNTNKLEQLETLNLIHPHSRTGGGSPTWHPDRACAGCPTKLGQL